MINRMGLSNRVFRSFGNFLTREQNPHIQSAEKINPTCIIPSSVLHVAYMNVYPNTIFLVLNGQLDGSTYETLISIGETLLSLNADCLIVDMSDISTVTNSGLIALNNLVRIMNGKDAVNITHGWAALHEMGMDFQARPQSHVKLLCPQPQILNILTQSGITQICETFDDIGEALKPLGWAIKD
jgi:ABC-type transporter Mla MlaB component